MIACRGEIFTKYLLTCWTRTRKNQIHIQPLKHSESFGASHCLSAQPVPQDCCCGNNADEKGFSRKKKGKKVIFSVFPLLSAWTRVWPWISLGSVLKRRSVQLFINCQAKRIDQFMISAVILKTVPFIHLYLLPLSSNCSALIACVFSTRKKMKKKIIEVFERPKISLILSPSQWFGSGQHMWDRVFGKKEQQWGNSISNGKPTFYCQPTDYTLLNGCSAL